MIRLALLSLILFPCAITDAFGQDTTEAQLQAFRTPPSPAFVLLGIEPSSVEKPSTPRAVAASFVTTVQQGGAIEVAPYWLASHPRLTFDDYYNANVGQTILQTLSLSFATAPRTDNADSVGTRVGLGARWMFVAGEPRDTLKSLRAELTKVQSKILDADDEAETARLMAEAKAIALAIQREDHLRVGFRLEMAASATMNFLNDNFSKGKFDRWGVWLTGAYLAEESSLDFLAVLRLMGDRKEVGTQNVFDAGGRLVSDCGDFSLSLEYILRSEISTTGTAQTSGGTSGTYFFSTTYRLAGFVEYHYNQDISVFLTFGRSYSAAQGGDGGLVAQVGVNFGLGEIPIIRQ